MRRASDSFFGRFASRRALRRTPQTFFKTMVESMFMCIRLTGDTYGECDHKESAAIAKRHDNNTLESVDGVIIRISGCINKSRTLSYGFSPEVSSPLCFIILIHIYFFSKVCDSFLSGFPCSWEDYAFKSSHDRCDDDTTKQSLPASFDDLRVTHVRHLLSSGTDSHALNSIIFGDIMKHTEMVLNRSVPSVEKISRNSVETEADHNDDDVSWFPKCIAIIALSSSRSMSNLTISNCKFHVNYSS
ncbi:putative transcription regulator Others family [Helianthus anomalus]